MNHLMQETFREGSIDAFQCKFQLQFFPFPWPFPPGDFFNTIGIPRRYTHTYGTYEDTE